MKKVIRMFAVLVSIAGLCIGCGKAEKPEPTKPAPVEQPAAHSADDGQDHSGHNH